jgi:hypothetical protein
MAEEKVINVVVEEETTWERVKRMAKKAKNRALDGIEYMIDHPAETAAKIGAATVLAKSVNGLVKSVTGPVKERRESRRYYDRDTKRALTSREEQELDYYVQCGGRAADWLRMKRLLR